MINTKGRGLEIGPSYNPILPKRMGYNVKGVDHADAETLRKKYAADPNAAAMVANIEEVDYIWTGGPLDALIGDPGAYDYIVASHVIEHMPDLLGFLKSCQTLLKPSGVLALAIPDKRYCFDYFRPHSTVGAVLDAHFAGRTRHTPGVHFDAAMLSCTMSGNIVWMEGMTGPLALAQGPELAWERYNEARNTGNYMDAHGWQFTPSSFRLILKTLYDLRLLDLCEAAFFETEGCEFMIGLSRSAPPPAHDYLALCHGIEAELAAGRVVSTGKAPVESVPDAGSVTVAAPSASPSPADRRRGPRSLRKRLTLNGLRRLMADGPA